MAKVDEGMAKKDAPAKVAALGDVDGPSDAAADVANSVASTEVVEPEVVEAIPIRAAGHREIHHLLFKNPTGGDIVIYGPDGGKVKIPSTKTVRFPAEPNSPDVDALVGYHRAIHLQAPQLVCEHGPKCEVAIRARPIAGPNVASEEPVRSRPQAG